MAACRDFDDLMARVAARGEAPCVAVGDERLDARTFARRVRAVAAALQQNGLEPGDRIAIHLHRSVDEAVVLLATMLAGGIAVPLHPRAKDDQVAHVLQDCAPRFVVASAVRQALLREPAVVLGGQELLHAGRALPGLASRSLDEWERAAGEAQRAAGDAAPLSPGDPGRAAILLYTSGSTGLQKGVIQSAHNLLLGAAVVADYLAMTAADRVLCVLPFSFDYGLNQLLAGLHTGASVTAADFLASAELATLLRTVRPTGLAGVPSLWHEIAMALQRGTLDDDDGRSLRYVTSSGGKLVVQDGAVLRRRWPWVQVFAMYGLTEAFRSAFLPPALYDAHPDSFGRALPGVELLLVDPDTGRVLDGAATGELVHAGALVALGYWQRPEATALRFRPDPRGRPGTVVFSGDLVRRDEAGLLHFVGRRDGLLKVAGHRISPDEIVHAVRDLAGVGEAVAFGLDGGSAGHRIVLCVAGDATDRDLPQRIARHCRSRLPAHMVPASVRVLAALPHTPNGKIDVAALRAAEERACTDDR